MKFFTTLLGKKPNYKDRRTSKPPKPREPVRDFPYNAQIQSLFINKLSAELRIHIYEYVLAAPFQLLHVLHCLPHKGELAQLGHWRCDNEADPRQVWQHQCFGAWRENGKAFYRRDSQANSDLMSLLLVCRLLYSEAREILYTHNEFSFRGARGLVKFQAAIPAIDWTRLRHVHLSTLFLTPMYRWMNCYLPPENYNHWTDGCLALASMTGLQSLKIDMIILNGLLRREEGIEDDIFLFIFDALKPIRAPVFDVEVNIELPTSVYSALGQLPCRIIVYKRPKDFNTFPLPA